MMGGEQIPHGGHRPPHESHRIPRGGGQIDPPLVSQIPQGVTDVPRGITDALGGSHKYPPIGVVDTPWVTAALGGKYPLHWGHRHPPHEAGAPPESQLPWEGQVPPQFGSLIPHCGHRYPRGG